MQKILVITTEQKSLRSIAFTHIAEDGDVIDSDRAITHSRYYEGFYNYKCPMFAIGDGWKLIAPPVAIVSPTTDLTYYEWWLTKD